MALIVEDGSRPAGANSYISAADATTYINTYCDNSNWPTDQPSQEAALLIACQALELNWADKYTSIRTLGTQSLLWPRYPFYDTNAVFIGQTTIPTQLMIAQAELALLQQGGTDLFPNESNLPNQTQALVKIGGDRGIEIDNRFMAGTSFSFFKKIDVILNPILKPKNATRIVR